jgi:tetratricopeptide (TPR) repeat protein
LIKLSSRLNKYFEPYLKRFIFDELSPSALSRMGIVDVLGDVPVPLQEEDMKNIAEGKGVTSARLAVNMAYVLGCVPDFKYAGDYLSFLKKLFKGGLYQGIIKAGEAEADSGALESACIYFRAALTIRPGELSALYGYTMICRELYLEAGKVEDEAPRFAEMSDEARNEYIGLFKAEAVELLEQMTIEYPDFADPYYFLGYAYLNMGLYIKADLTFKDYLSKGTDFEKKEDARSRREQLVVPVKIENGINAVTGGRFEEGIKILSEHAGTDAAKGWWPIHYYLGMAYLRCNMLSEGVSELRECLKLNPSHMDSMEELIWAYEALGEPENEEKYKKKLELVRGYAKEDGLSL